MSGLAFVDTETTGLDDAVHDVWEIAVITRDPGGTDVEYLFHLAPDLSRASPKALELTNFYERVPELAFRYDRGIVARQVAALLDGRHMVGAVPDFDARFLWALLRDHVERKPWHYHLIDVEPLAVGYLHGYGKLVPGLPWNSEDLSRAVGVEPRGQRHTALSDARWVRDIYDAIVPRPQLALA